MTHQAKTDIASLMQERYSTVQALAK